MVFKKLIEKIYLSFKDNLAYYDSITKCKTRLYYDLVAIDKYAHKSCVIVFVDIDNLKCINDTKGHTYGTLFIKEIGYTLLSMDNVYDICRIGGDEFIMFCKPCFDITQFNSLNDKISIGYYRKTANDNIEYAINQADRKMYNNKIEKKSGR